MGLSDLTVFVVADDDRGGRIRDTVAAWTEQGLLVPSVWVRPADVRAFASGPPQVSAELLTADERRVDDLFRIVGRRRLRTVRLVVGQMVDLDGAHDVVLAEAARLVARALADAVPLSSDGGGTTLRTLNLLIPVSGAAGASPAALQRGWDVNAVVSAEDRPDVDRASAFVRDPGNLAGHAATALAACGAVLVGIEEGVLDVLAPSTANGDDVQLVRICVRAVVGQDVESLLAVRALTSVQEEPLGPGRFVEWGRLAADPERVVDDLTTNLLSTEPWVSGEPATVRSAHRRQTAPWDAVKDAVRFDVRMFTTVVRWVVGARRARLEEHATALLVGAEGDTVIRFEPGSPERMAEEAARHLVEVDHRAREAEIERESAAVAFPDPSTWGTLRGVAFAAVDGGGLPDAVPEPRFAGVREILAPSRVAPDPLGTFVTRAGVTLAAGDPVEARRYRLDVGRRAQTLQRLARPVEPGPDGVLDPAAVRAQSKAAAELEPLLAERARLDSWLRTVGSSVLWRLADDIGRRRFVFHEKQAAARQRFTTQAPPHDALVRSKRALIRWWCGTLAVWLVALVVAAVALGGGADVEIWHWASWFLGLTAAAAVLLGVGNHQFYKAVRRYGWDVRRLVEERQRASEESVFYGRESRRLDQLYATLTDWVTIVGWALHHPTSQVVTEADDVDDAVVDSFPAAFGVARTAADDDIPSGTVVQAVRRLHPVGWAATQFDQAYEEFRATLASDSDSGFIAADLDTLAGDYTPRRLLLDFWRGGDAASVLTHRAVDALRRAVHDELIVLPMRRVARTGDHSDDGSVPEPAFYEAATKSSPTFVTDGFTPAGMMARAHYVARSVAWTPRGVRAPAGQQTVEMFRAGANVALRADVSGLLALDHLRVFAATDAHAADRTVREAGPEHETERPAPAGAVFH
jgi:hypothetical protein